MQKTTTILKVKGGELELRFSNYALYLLDKQLGESVFARLQREAAAPSLSFLVSAISAGLSWDPTSSTGMTEEKICHLLDMNAWGDYVRPIFGAILAALGHEIPDEDGTDEDPTIGAVSALRMVVEAPDELPSEPTG